MGITINDVAKEAGVSISTVSRVLNGNYPVKKETREKVEVAIKKLNFQPNPIARSLVSKKTMSIGVVVPSITNMYFTEVIEGIERYCFNKEYDVYLSVTNGDYKHEKKMIDKFLEKYVDGIIVVDPQTKNIKNGYIQAIAKKIPLVCINGYHENIEINFIISDEKKGTKDAIQYLYELGHKKIAFVRGENSYSYDIKEAIYYDYVNKSNQKPIIINVKDGNSIDVVENTKQKIINLHNNEYIIGRDITAFFTCNDLMAVGTLNGCIELNLKVPDDISVIGFDNIILSQMTSPKITTVDQNMRLLGERAAKVILDLICDNRMNYLKIFIDTFLIKRESCKML